MLGLMISLYISLFEQTGIKVYEMREKELVIEPVIRWASIANVTVDVKVHSFKLSAQVSFVPRCIIQTTCLDTFHYTRSLT